MVYLPWYCVPASLLSHSVLLCLVHTSSLHSPCLQEAASCLTLMPSRWAGSTTPITVALCFRIGNMLSNNVLEHSFCNFSRTSINSHTTVPFSFHQFYFPSSLVSFHWHLFQVTFYFCPQPHLCTLLRPPR